jgi:hypothetical protein
MGMSDSEPKDPDKGRNYFVKASINKGEYYCQCCKFERDGIVCCHILKIMDMHAVTRLPAISYDGDGLGTLTMRWGHKHQMQFWLYMMIDQRQPWTL